MIKLWASFLLWAIFRGGLLSWVEIAAKPNFLYDECIVAGIAVMLRHVYCVVFAANAWIMAERVLRDGRRVHSWRRRVLHSCVWLHSAVGTWRGGVASDWYRPSWHGARRYRRATGTREASFRFGSKPGIRTYRNGCMSARLLLLFLFWLTLVSCN